MEWLKNMSLRRSFFLLSVTCLAVSMLFAWGIYFACGKIGERYPRGGVAIEYTAIENGVSITELPTATPRQMRILGLLNRIQILALLIMPVSGLGLAGVLFYRFKLKKPIGILKTSAERIRRQELDFTITDISGDELGEVCTAFETMRKELLRTNRELWRQAEERKRLNAVFAHDLRNPVTVIKGSVKQMRQSGPDEQVLKRLETYTLRIERYIEAMSSIQRLEQMPLNKREIDTLLLVDELRETAGLLAPTCRVSLYEQGAGVMELDHGLFLTVAENLIGNAARFTRTRLKIILRKEDAYLRLSISDDGPGYPDWLLKDGPKPFGKRNEDAEHFGMGLYCSYLLCTKHGGTLVLENDPEIGATAEASFLC